MSLLSRFRARSWSTWEALGISVGSLLLLFLVALGAPASAIWLIAMIAYLFLQDLSETYDEVPDGLRSRFLRVRMGLVDNAAELALYLAIGSGLIWLLEIGLGAFNPDPDSFGPWQVSFLEAAEHYKAWFSAVHILIAVGGAFLLSIVLNTLWPMVWAARARLWILRGGMVISAMTVFTFVGVGEAATRGETAVSRIKAEIAGDVGGLIEAEKEKAAYHWLNATLRVEAVKAPSPSAFQNDIDRGLQACANANETYKSAYDSTFSGHDPYDTFCDETRFAKWFARGEVRSTSRPSSPGSDADWVPEFRQAVIIDGNRITVATSVTTRSVPTSEIEALQELRHRTKSAAYDAKMSRDMVRDTVISLVAGLLPEVTAPLHEVIADAWREAIVGILVNESADQIARRLKLNHVKLPIAVAAVLEIDGTIEIPPGGENTKSEDSDKRAAAALLHERVEAWQESPLGGPYPSDDPKQAGAKAGADDKRQADLAAKQKADQEAREHEWRKGRE